MKKLATLIATSALALAGVMIAPVATAAEPYPQSVATACAVVTNSPVKKGKIVRARVNWTSAGNVTPRGKILVKIVRKRDGKVVRGYARKYYGKPVKFRFKRLRPGAYRVRVQGITEATSVFKGCRTRGFVRVKRR